MKLQFFTKILQMIHSIQEYLLSTHFVQGIKTGDIREDRVEDIVTTYKTLQTSCAEDVMPTGDMAGCGPESPGEAEQGV